MRGPNKYSILQMKDAIRDGIRAVKNTIEDGGHVLLGAGAFELAAYQVCVITSNRIDWFRI